MRGPALCSKTPKRGPIPTEVGARREARPPTPPNPPGPGGSSRPEDCNGGVPPGAREFLRGAVTFFVNFIAKTGKEGEPEAKTGLPT
jgi:hypothetical protein